MGEVSAVERIEVDVVVVAWGEELWLEECVSSILGSHDVEVHLTVVDNGCSNTVLAALAERGVEVCRPGENLGFAAGCNLGAARGSAPVLALVNSDARVDPRALRVLAEAAGEGALIASAAVLLADEPEKLNSCGNPVHYLGLSWSGGLGEAASEHLERRQVASASGATLAVSRALWEQLGGFEECFFTYCEDADLSLRALQLGARTEYIPQARSLHHYEFSRNPEKFYHLERNRLMMVLTLFESRTLARLLPAACVLELAVLAASIREGWWRQKLRGWWWLWRNRGLLRTRRARVQQARVVGDEVVLGVLSSRVETPALGDSAALAALNCVLEWWWRTALAGQIADGPVRSGLWRGAEEAGRSQG